MIEERGEARGKFKEASVSELGPVTGERLTLHHFFNVFSALTPVRKPLLYEEFNVQPALIYSLGI